MGFFADLKAKFREEMSLDTSPKPAPDYCTPKKYEVGLVDGVFLAHFGANRHERRRLAVLYDNFEASKRFPTRESLRKFLKTTPSNFPLRRIHLNGKKTYLFEPEYWDLVQKMKDFQAAEEVLKQAETLPVLDVPAPVLVPQYA